MLELHFEAFQMPRDKVKYPWTYFARLLGALLLLGYLIYKYLGNAIDNRKGKKIYKLPNILPKP